MNPAEAIASPVAPVYVPPFQLTDGQPPPIAANRGRSYASLNRNGDAGTAAATEAALAQIAQGEGQVLIETIVNAPPGPIETQWGLGFRRYEECLDYIRVNNIEAPEGGRGSAVAVHSSRTAVLLRGLLQRALAGCRTGG